MRVFIIYFVLLLVALSNLNAYETVQFKNLSFRLPDNTNYTITENDGLSTLRYTNESLEIQIEELHTYSTNANNDINVPISKITYANNIEYMYGPRLDVLSMNAKISAIQRIFAQTNLFDNTGPAAAYNFSHSPTIIEEESNYIKSHATVDINYVLDSSGDGSFDSLTVRKINIIVIFDGDTFYGIRVSYVDHPSFISTLLKPFFVIFPSTIISSYIPNPLADDNNNGITNKDEVFLYRRITYQETDSNQDGIDDKFFTKFNIDTLNSSSLEKVEYLKAQSDVLGMYSQNDIQDLRPGSTMIEVTNGQANVELKIEESSDMLNWSDTGHEASVNLPATGNKKFFRFKMED